LAEKQSYFSVLCGVYVCWNSIAFASFFHR
jgi:hypothetical protein